ARRLLRPRRQHLRGRMGADRPRDVSAAARVRRMSMRCVLLCVLAIPLGAFADDDLAPAQRYHWGWKRPERRPLTAVRAAAWARNPIDVFLLARVEAAGLRPSSPATREQLIRRVTFDLVGLPPTPEESAAFVQDPSPDAWDKVIERLLA